MTDAVRARKTEIEQRLGFFPPFFEPALDDAGILDSLWLQTRSAYLDNPIPAVFKETLFANLANRCRIPFCTVCHSCTLSPQGLTTAAVIDMLVDPPQHDKAELERKALELSASTDVTVEWPREGSMLEDALFAIAILAFDAGDDQTRNLAEFRHLVSAPIYAQFTSLLDYVRACHAWVERYPELSYQANTLIAKYAGSRIAEDKRLAEFIADYPDYLSRQALFDAERLAEATEREQRHDRAQAALREADERFRRVFEEGPMAMALVGPDRKFLKANTAFYRLFGYGGEELQQLTFADITHPEDVELDAHLENKTMVGEIPSYRIEKRFITKSQEVIHGNLTTAAIHDAGDRPTYSVAIVEDVTARRSFENEMRHFAERDPLTGLFNRRRLEGELRRSIANSARHGRSGALLVADIDNLKQVNDTHGHAAGDQLIRNVAMLLQARLRKTDMLARFGGDEFAMLLPETEPEQAQAVADDLVDAIRGHSLVIDGRLLRASVSLGITTITGASRPAAQLMADADLAMYEAKNSGRDRTYTFSLQLESENAASGEDSWSKRVGRAIDDDALVLYCQPILNLQTGDADRYELLLRMKGRRGELVLPETFLYTAERFGVAPAFDTWVLQSAIKLLSETSSSNGAGPALAINFSGKSIADADFIARLERELAEAEFDHSRLAIEITETAAITDTEQIRKLARILHRHGCTLGLDDFGAGFGSFNYLKYVPVDYLKVDGEIIGRLPESRTDQLIVQAMVEVAKALDKKTVAEWVTAPESIDLLHDYGVDFAQGYYLGGPHPLSEVDEFQPVAELL